jgi:hypothetical protein
MPKPRKLDLINVFYFRAWDADQQKLVTSKRAATFDAIKRRNGVPMTETKQTVPRLLLDEDGFLLD